MESQQRRAAGKAAVKRALTGALAAPADPFAELEGPEPVGAGGEEPGAGWRVSFLGGGRGAGGEFDGEGKSEGLGRWRRGKEEQGGNQRGSGEGKTTRAGQKNGVSRAVGDDSVHDGTPLHVLRSWQLDVA